MIETDLQALFDIWTEAKKSGNEATAMLAIQKIHLNVYSYARKRFGADEETSSDFYLYFLSKIEPILENYTKKSNFDFKVFFCFRMRGAYFNFLKSKGRKLENQITSTEWNENLVQDNEVQEEDESSLLQSLKMKLGGLESKKRLILKLYFGVALKLADFRQICALFGPQDGFVIARNYTFTLKEIELKNFERKSSVHEKLANLFYAKKDELAKEKRREHLLAELKLTQIKSPFSFKTLSALLGWSRAKTGRSINEALADLKILLKPETKNDKGGIIR
jgi:hypothetical protein